MQHVAIAITFAIGFGSLIWDYGLRGVFAGAVLVGLCVGGLWVIGRMNATPPSD